LDEECIHEFVCVQDAREKKFGLKCVGRERGLVVATPEQDVNKTRELGEPEAKHGHESMGLSSMTTSQTAP
jgi:hypothetical protein